MTLADPVIPAFTPPVQLVDLTTDTTTHRTVSSVNVAINPATGLLAVSSYTYDQPTLLAKGTSPIPSAEPQLWWRSATEPQSGYGISFDAPTSGYIGNDGHEYILVEAPRISWQDAKAAAPSGFHLATISSANENTLVENLVNASAVDGEEYWLGGSRLSSSSQIWAWENNEGQFWDDDDTVGVYANWNTAEPSGDGSYLAMWTDANRNQQTSGTWNDEGGCIDCVSGYVLESTSDVSSGGGAGYTYQNGTMTVWGYLGTDVTQNGVWKLYPLANGPQTIDLTTCLEGSDVVLVLDADSTSTTPDGATGSVYCSLTVSATASQPMPQTTPTLVKVVTSATASPIGELLPDSPYDSGTGMLTVTGYDLNGQTVKFANGDQTLDMTQCAQDTAVTVTITPIGTNGLQAYGFVTCQEGPASLPYAACTGDPWATGGVIAAITGAPNDQGEDATFELACACIPDYLGGAEWALPGQTTNNDPYRLSSLDAGKVAVGATSKGENPLSGTDVGDPGPGRRCKE